MLLKVGGRSTSTVTRWYLLFLFMFTNIVCNILGVSTAVTTNLAHNMLCNRFQYGIILSSSDYETFSTFFFVGRIIKTKMKSNHSLAKSFLNTYKYRKKIFRISQRNVQMQTEKNQSW